MYKFLFAVFLTLALSTGCSLSWVDARGPSDRCEVHHTLMRVEQLPGGGNNVVITPEYVAARRKLFFHSYPFTLPKKYGRTYVVYICDDCVAAERAWMKQHPEY